jgi:hypothetical protein
MEIAEAIQSFRFEEDFMEDNIRCIPMIVRFKLDACGIKLKLSEWSKFTIDERAFLAEFRFITHHDITSYRSYLQDLVFNRTKREATDLAIEAYPPWSIVHQIPEIVMQRMREHHWKLSVSQWEGLSKLQRFALVKLSRSSHENKNFPKAVKEFGLMGTSLL